MLNARRPQAAAPSAAVMIPLISILFALAPAPAGALVLNVEFEQLSFIHQDSDPVINSSIGRCLVEFSAEPQMEFFNLAAIVPGLTPEPVWIVRNMPLHDITVGMPVEIQGMCFPLDELGVTEGMQVTDIVCGWTAMPDILLDEDFESWLAGLPLDQPKSVQPAESERNKGFDRDHLPENIDPQPWWWPPFVPGFYLDPVCWIGCQMPNLDLAGGLDVNGCGPAGCANSLRWLANQDDNDVDMDESEREAFDQLSHLMSRLSADGVDDSTMVKAKLDFIEAHGLPIQVKFQSKDLGHTISSTTGRSYAADSSGVAGMNSDGWPEIGWLQSEARSKEDVEIGVGRYYKDDSGKTHRVNGHVVALTGMLVIGDHIVISWKHDDRQSAPGGTYHEVGFADTTGGRIYIPGLDGEVTVGGKTYRTYAKVESVISESPTSTPGLGEVEEPMIEFCTQHKRMLAPGDTLKIEFPPIEKQNLNVTLWIQDTSVHPFRTTREVVWTKNSGKTRKLYNNSDKPLMVVVHNDDDSRDRDTGAPKSYGVNESIGRGTPPAPGKAAKTESPDNQEESGGFSLGWRDSSSAEFTCPAAAGPVLAGPVQNGFDLAAVPPRLSTGGVAVLDIQVPIPVWHEDWTYLRFILDAAAVHAPGQLRVECFETGDDFLLDVTAPGRFEQELAELPHGSPELNLRLTAMGGLDFELDSLGAPTMLPATVGVDGDVPAPVRPQLAAWPNPANPKVMLKVQLPEPGEAELAVWDLRGRLVATIWSGPMSTAERTFTWDGLDASGRPAAAGTYVFRLLAGDHETTRKVSLVR